MFYHIFFSPHVKRCAIISYKHGIFQLPQELPNYLRAGIFNPTAFLPMGGSVPTEEKKKSWDLRKLGNIRRVSRLYRMIAQCPVPLPK